jgi:AraC-like DNA-binding protein
MTPTVRLPSQVFHEIQASGRFMHFDRDFTTRYRGATHALHLYEYDCVMRWSGIERRIVPGDLSFSPAEEESRYHLARPGRHWCIHFTPQGPGDTPLELPVFVRLGRRAEFVAERFAHVSRLYARGRGEGGGSRLATVAAMAALQELLLWLALEGGADRTHPRGRVDAAAERAAEVLSARFAEALAMPTLARQLGVSQHHLARRFRARYGVTMPRFLLARRVERARQLLATTDLPVRDIAAAVGMPDPQHFNKQYRRLVGHAPSAERPAVNSPLRG